MPIAARHADDTLIFPVRLVRAGGFG